MTWNARLVQIQIILVFYLEDALSLYGGRPLRSHHPEIAEEEDAILADEQAEIAKQKNDAAFLLKQFVIKPPSQLHERAVASVYGSVAAPPAFSM